MCRLKNHFRQRGVAGAGPIPRMRFLLWLCPFFFVMLEIPLQIQGLGMFPYSPDAVAHIPEGADYLRDHFWEPADVARHVMECRLTGFGTGSPGSFRLHFLEGPPEEAVVESLHFKLRLGLQVNGGVICVHDLYDLMEWSRTCPDAQQIHVPDGWYRLTVISSTPPSGILGDEQGIVIFLESVECKPQLHWAGVPSLC